MSRPSHLILPFANAAGLDAGFAGAAGPAALAGDLPVLRRVLARLQAGPLIGGDTQGLSPPHERVRAQALGLPLTDGAIPWAAWTLAQAGAQDGKTPGDDAWAWITPCHWHVARDHILMRPSAQLELDETASRALLAAIAPYFQEDGIALTYEGPTQWLACGEVFRGLTCASLDRVEGRKVDDWLPRTPAARPLRRLQQEMQMLLYTHPVNETREQSGLRPVNSFWVSGAGALSPAPAGVSPVQMNDLHMDDLRVDDRLRAPALAGDAAQWTAHWRALDAQVLPPLLEAVEQGHPVALTLCGERHARTWSTSPAGAWWQRAARRLRLRPPPVAAALEAL